MAWIAVVPPSPRHRHERYQVCYAEQLSPQTLNTYLSLLGTILNAARAAARGQGSVTPAHPPL